MQGGKKAKDKNELAENRKRMHKVRELSLNYDFKLVSDFNHISVSFGEV